MGGSRIPFNNFCRIQRKDFEPDKMPNYLRAKNNRWVVYNQYKLYKPEKDEFIHLLSQAGVDISSDSQVDDLYKNCDEFIMVKPDSGISRVYYPFTDATELFLEFATLGRTETPRKDIILSFLHRYGNIISPAGKENLSLDGWYFDTDIYWFQREARQCYLALRLYEELQGNNIENIKNKAIQLKMHFLKRWTLFSEPEIFTDIFNELMAFQNTVWLGKDVPEILSNIFNTLMENREHKEGQNLPDSLMVEIKPKDVIDFASMLLSDVTTAMINIYMYDPIMLSCNYRTVIKNNKAVPKFYMAWSIPTLLQAIWLLFFLKITGQLEQSYRICPVCEEPIIDPRKNQVYHDGCRQVYHNRLKREVLRLWKEGKTMGEIVNETGIEEERITKWVKGRKDDGRVTGKEG